MRPEYEIVDLRLGKPLSGLVPVSKILDVAISATEEEIDNGAFYLHLRDNDLDLRMGYLENVTGEKHRDRNNRKYGFPEFEKNWGDIRFDGILCLPEGEKKISGDAKYAWGSSHIAQRYSENPRMYGLKVLACNMPEETDITLTSNETPNSLLASEKHIGNESLSILSEEYRNLLRMFGTTHYNLMRLKTQEYLTKDDINKKFNQLVYEKYGTLLNLEGMLKSDIAIDIRKFLFDSRKNDYSLPNLLQHGKAWGKEAGSPRSKTGLFQYLNKPIEQYQQDIDKVIEILGDFVATAKELHGIAEIAKYVNKTQVHVDKEIYTMPIIQCEEPSLYDLENVVEMIGEVLRQFGDCVLQCDIRPDIMGIPYMFSNTLAVWLMHDIGLAHSTKRVKKS